MNNQHCPGSREADIVSAARAGSLKDAPHQPQHHIEKPTDQRFQRLFDTQPSPLLVLSKKGIVLASNRSAHDLFGLTGEQFSGRPFAHRVAPQDQTLFAELLDALAGQPEAETALVAMTLADGSPDGRHCELRLARQPALEADSAREYEVIVHIVDVSALKQKEEQLRQQTELLANVSNELPGALLQYRMLTAEDYCFDYVSAGVESIFGVTAAELMQHPGLVFERMHPEDLGRMRLVLSRMYMEPEAWEGEFRVCRGQPQGWAWLKARVHPRHLDTAAGPETIWYGYIEDVTEQREATRMLIAHARRAAMGDMLGNIAHQWKQPLNALGLSLGNLEDALIHEELGPEAVGKHVDKSRQLMAQMNQTIRDFVRFFHPDKAVEQFSAAQMAHNALDLLSTSLQRYGIACEEDLPDDLPLLTGQPTELMQVVMILLQNAEEALRARAPAEPWLAVRCWVEDQQLLLAVSDNAGGVDEAVQQQMFEPYFSTKQGGSGIGLYLARLIVESSFGGRIGCRNTEHGAEFRLELPIRRDP